MRYMNRRMTALILTVLLTAGYAGACILVKENTAVSLPFIMINATDFKTPLTGLTNSSVTVLFKHAADSTFTSVANNVDEIGYGVYEVDFEAADFGSEGATNEGIFLYVVNGSDMLTYYGCAQMMGSNSLNDISDDVDAILADTGEIQANQSNFITAAGFSTSAELNTSLAAGITVLTSATETQIDNIEADTNELQGNQSNLITATGFSTHNTSDVYDYFIAGSNENQFKSTGFSTHNESQVWEYGTRILTAIDEDDTTLDFDATIVAIPAATETQIDNIEGDTNELQLNQSSFITATGFSTHNESDVYGYFISGSNEDEFKAANYSTHNTSDVYEYFTAASNEDEFKCTGYSTHNTSDVYDYFIAGSNENQFKADVSWLGSSNLTADDLNTACASQAEINSDHGTGSYNTTASCSSHNVSDVYNYFTAGSNEDQFKATGFSTLNESLVWEYAGRTLTALDEDSTSIDLDGTTMGVCTSVTNAVTVDNISDDVITAAVIANDAITNAEIAASAIGSSEIATAAIGAAQIAADAITSSELADSAVNEIVDQIWNELSTGHTSAGFAGAQLWTDVDAILADTDELQQNQSSFVSNATSDAASIWSYSSRTLTNYSNLLCNASLYGHDFPIELTDNVTTALGAPIPDVHVVAYLVDNQATGAQVADDFTDANGEWELWLNEGNYTLGFFKTGYATSWENRTVTR